MRNAAWHVIGHRRHGEAGTWEGAVLGHDFTVSCFRLMERCERPLDCMLWLPCVLCPQCSDARLYASSCSAGFQGFGGTACSSL